MNESKICEGCGKTLKPYGTVNFGSMDKGYSRLCLACYNATTAEYYGLKFQHVEFDPLKVADAGGVDHEFHFTMRLTGNGVALDAHEMKAGLPCGYQFQIFDEDPEKDPLELFKQMLERIRRQLSRKHLEPCDLIGIAINEDRVVRGRIECDLESDQSDRVPLLVIDGREIPWEQFGRMLMSYEGWNFKLEIFDPSEER